MKLEKFKSTLVGSGNKLSLALKISPKLGIIFIIKKLITKIEVISKIIG